MRRYHDAVAGRAAATSTQERRSPPPHQAIHGQERPTGTWVDGVEGLEREIVAVVGGCGGRRREREAGGCDAKERLLGGSHTAVLDVRAHSAGGGQLLQPGRRGAAHPSQGHRRRRGGRQNLCVGGRGMGTASAVSGPS